MQSWILDHNFYVSASMLDRNRLQANIYENIHGIASLLGINNQLVNQKRSVANHPNIKRWSGYLGYYFHYICVHIDEWVSRGYKNDINKRNMDIIFNHRNTQILIEVYRSEYTIPNWITDDLIKEHKQILYKKDPEYYKQFKE